MIHSILYKRTHNINLFLFHERNVTKIQILLTTMHIFVIVCCCRIIHELLYNITALTLSMVFQDILFLIEMLGYQTFFLFQLNRKRRFSNKYIVTYIHILTLSLSIIFLGNILPIFYLFCSFFQKILHFACFNFYL
jgi:hypothetical protein